MEQAAGDCGDRTPDAARALHGPRHARAVEAAREAMSIMEGRARPGPSGRGNRLQELIHDILELDGWDAQLLESGRARRGDGASSAKSTKWNKRLPQQQRRRSPVPRNHEASSMPLPARASTRPLCDVVEVVEEDWQYAVEALLGRGREAIIVDPSRLNEAFDLMEGPGRLLGLRW